MIEIGYDKLLDKIAKASGLAREELERRVEAKRAKLSGLISKEGAAQVIAAELGINFDDEKLKIDELLPGMKKVNVVGKVINLFPVREFVRNDKPGKVVNFVIADETSNIRVVLWDTNHIELIEKKQVELDTIVEIANASMRDGELHLGSFSEFKVSNEALGEVKTEKILKEKKIEDFKISDNVKSRSFILQAFEPRFFEVCSECKRKVEEQEGSKVCKEHGKVSPEKRALINIVLDDGSDSIRAVLFHEALGLLGLGDLNDADGLIQKRQGLLGKEMIFCGTVRQNKFFNNNEFIVDDVQEVDVDKLIKELENK